jgi:hypothetical protein
MSTTVWSRPSGPVSSGITVIRSSTRRAIGPICHSASIQPPAGGKWPVRGRRPEVGLMAAHPQKAAGRRTLPAQSLPRPSGEPQAEISAASPPLDPPGVRAVSYGLRVAPKIRLSLSKANSRSGRLVLAMGMAPARRKRPTSVASSSGGCRVLAAQRSRRHHRASHLDRILDAAGHAVQRAARFARVGRGGGGQRAIGEHFHGGVCRPRRRIQESHRHQGSGPHRHHFVRRLFRDLHRRQPRQVQAISRRGGLS